MTPITSADNSNFRAWLRLATQGRARRARGLTLAEGLHLAEAALESGTQIAAWIVRRGAPAGSAGLQALIERLQRQSNAGFELPPALYARLDPVEHGVGLLLVIATRHDPAPVASRSDLVFLDGIQDPGNVGTVLRIAAAASIRHVLGGIGCADFWSPKTLRAGMGAQFRLRLTEQVDAAQLAGALDGQWLACDAHDATSLWSLDLDPAQAVGWVFGAEGRGISAEVAATCRARVRIPIDPAIESLNVAAAAAICLFERRRLAEIRDSPGANIGEASGLRRR